MQVAVQVLAALGVYQVVVPLLVMVVQDTHGLQVMV
jgi:hypothetical protein